MSELDDVRLERSEGEPGDGGPGGRSPWGWVVALVVLLAAGGGIAWWLLRGDAEPEPAPGVEEAAPIEPAPEVVEPVEEEPLELPPLDASDEAVRRLVAGLSSQPALASWLATEDLVERFVVAVDNVAVGVVPRKEVEPLAPEGGFRAAAAEGGEARVDPASWERYDPAAAVVASLEPRGTATLYRRLRPLVDEAARERLGYGAERFDQTLRRAILHLLETPVPAEPPALERETLTYRYADPRLEELSEAQKQLLRMGPRNQRRVQAKLRALARELGVPAERVPRERVLAPAA